MTTNQRLLKKLKQIAAPSAAYNRNKEIYLNNIVQVCIGLAKDCIQIIEKDQEEGGNNTFEQGQEVVVIANSMAHGFEIGSTVNLVYKADKDWFAMGDNDWTWWVSENDIKHK